MKKTIGYWAVCAMTALVATTFVACGEKESSAAGGGTGEKLWKSETKEYKNFTDLGNYWLHNDDHFEAAKALAYAQIHIRYNDNGEFDMNCMSKYDKLSVSSFSCFSLFIIKTLSPLFCHHVML